MTRTQCSCSTTFGPALKARRTTAISARGNARRADRQNAQLLRRAAAPRREHRSRGGLRSAVFSDSRAHRQVKVSSERAETPNVDKIPIETLAHTDRGRSTVGVSAATSASVLGGRARRGFPFKRRLRIRPPIAGETLSPDVRSGTLGHASRVGVPVAALIVLPANRRRSAVARSFAGSSLLPGSPPWKLSSFSVAAYGRPRNSCGSCPPGSLRLTAMREQQQLRYPLSRERDFRRSSFGRLHSRNLRVDG